MSKTIPKKPSLTIQVPESLLQAFADTIGRAARHVVEELEKSRPPVGPTTGKNVQPPKKPDMPIIPGYPYLLIELNTESMATLAEMLGHVVREAIRDELAGVLNR